MLPACRPGTGAKNVFTISSWVWARQAIAVVCALQPIPIRIPHPFARRP